MFVFESHAYRDMSSSVISYLNIGMEHTYTHTFTHTYIHTHTHIHAHIHTRTHIYTYDFYCENDFFRLNLWQIALLPLKGVKIEYVVLVDYISVLLCVIQNV